MSVQPRPRVHNHLLKLIKRNPGKRAINAAEPKFRAPEIPAPSKHLNKEATAEWIRLCSELVKRGYSPMAIRQDLEPVGIELRRPPAGYMTSALAMADWFSGVAGTEPAFS